MTKSSSSSLYFVSIDTKRLILKNTCLDNNIHDSKHLNIRSAEEEVEKFINVLIPIEIVFSSLSYSFCIHNLHTKNVN